MAAELPPAHRTNLTAALRDALAGVRGGIAPAPARADRERRGTGEGAVERVMEGPGAGDRSTGERGIGDRAEPRVRLPVPVPVPAAAPLAPSIAAAVRTPRRLLNATGRIFDPVLGLPPLADAAAAAMRGPVDAAAASEAIAALLAALTGAPASLVVGDSATALVLALTAHAAPGGEVVVARGELWEHDRGVRVPELITDAGAQGFEIGSIDHCVPADLADAITPATRVLLKLHRPRAFEGPVTALTVGDLAAAGQTHRLLVVHALGSGALHTRLDADAVPALLADGADLVVFGGDRLLGGPQCGIVVGTEAALRPIRRLTLARAGRPDGRVLAALAATLRLHRDAAEAAERIPALRLLHQDRIVLDERAARLAGLLSRSDAAVVRTAPTLGGGVRPLHAPESRAVAFPSADAAATVARLGSRSPAVAALAERGRVKLDVLALADSELGEVAEAVRAA